MASRPLRCFTKAWAACSGLPTSGRTESPLPWALASNAATAPSKSATHRTACRRPSFIAYLLVQELFRADQADLRDAEALRRGHHVRDVFVSDELVRTKVE